MAGAHYPRLSPSGLSWCAGDTKCLVDGVEIGPGRQPQWQDERTIICLAPAVGVIRYRLQESGLWAQDWLDRTLQANDLSVSAAGWAAYTTVPEPRIVTSDERVFSGYGAPALAPDGRLAMARHANGSVWVATHGAATILTTHPSRDLRWTDAAITFTAYPSRTPEVWWSDGVRAADRIGLDFQEYACCAVSGPAGRIWLLTIDDHRLLLRVMGESVGYVLADQANTFNPDARWVESKQRFHVVSATRGGIVDEWWVDPATTRVRLSAPVVPVPVPVPVPTPVPVPDMNTEYASFDWSRATYHKCASEVGEWPIVLRLHDAFVPPPTVKGIVTEWENTADWPSTDPGPGPGLVGNCGIVAKIGGTWRVATYDWLRYPDQDSKDESLTSVRLEQVNEQPWLAWNPQNGEVVGLFVCGPARTGVRTARERSAIAWVKIGQPGILAHEGSTVPQPTPMPVPVPTPQPSPDIEALKLLVATLTARVRASSERLDAIEEAQRDYLRSGERVALRTDDGHYVCAESGGGGEVNATRTGVGGWELFTVERR